MDNAIFLKKRKRHTSIRFEMCDKKALDYTQMGDRLDNFKRNGKELDLSPLRVLGVYMKKHIDAILRYLRTDGEEEYSEDIVDRVYDLQNYGDLLLGLVEELQEGEKNDGSNHVR